MGRTEALAYIGRALEHSGIDRNQVFDMFDMPNILEKYDLVEELTQEEADVVMSVVIEAVQKQQFRNN